MGLTGQDVWERVRRRGLPNRIPGLVAWWKADTSVALTAGKVSQWDDLSGKGNHATQVTAGLRPLLRHGPPSPAVSLPDANAFVEFPISSTLKVGAGSFVVAVWYRPTAVTLGEVGVSHALASYGTSYVDGYLVNQIGTALNVYANSGGPQLAIAGFFDTADIWYRIVVVCDAGTGLIKVYKNSVLVATSGATSWNVTLDQVTRVGKPPTVLAGPNGGLISEFQLGKGASAIPTQAQIDLDYRHRDALPGLVASYGLHDGSFPVVSSVAGAPNGTVGGTATWGAPAFNGDALYFDPTATTSLNHSCLLQAPATVAFVARRDAVVANYQPIVSFSPIGTNGIFVYAKAGAVDQWGMYATGDANSGAGGTLDVFKVGVLRVRAVTDVDLRTNGASVTSAAGTAPYNGGGVMGYTGGTQSLAGEIVEIAAWNRVLSIQECARVERYLKRRHGT
jgi:hypothetical protein